MSRDNAVELWRQRIIDRLLDHKRSTGSGNLTLETGDRIAAYFGIDLTHKPLFEGQVNDTGLFVKALETLKKEGILEGGFASAPHSDTVTLVIQFKEGVHGANQKFLDEIDGLLTLLEKGADRPVDAVSAGVGI